MVEMLFVIGMVKWVGDIVEKKGYGSILFKVLVVVGWFAGEILGLLVGILLRQSSGAPGPGGFPIKIYGIALVGALLGASIVFFIALILPDTGEGTSRAARRRRRRDEEDDRPRRRDDYDDEDRPRRRRADEDDQDRPRRRRAAEDEDRIRRRDDDDRPPRRRDDRYRRRADDDY
jgi:hypothetical protein